MKTEIIANLKEMFPNHCCFHVSENGELHAMSHEDFKNFCRNNYHEILHELQIKIHDSNHFDSSWMLPTKPDSLKGISQPIKVIKFIRQETGLSLREAKDFVDFIASLPVDNDLRVEFITLCLKNKSESLKDMFYKFTKFC